MSATPPNPYHAPKSNSNSPPLTESSSKKPFAQQAAQFSVFAPIVSIILGIVLRGAGEVNPILAILTPVICLLLILLGFLFGILALFGMKKHGKKGILVRSIVGICLNGFFIILILIAIPATLKAIEKAKEINRQQIEQRQR